MDDLSPNKLAIPQTQESEFRREEAELRRWLEANVTDLAARKWYQAQLKADHVARGRRFG